MGHCKTENASSSERQEEQHAAPKGLDGMEPGVRVVLSERNRAALLVVLQKVKQEADVNGWLPYRPFADCK